MGLFTMPSLGSDMEAGTLAEWLVKPGDRVSRGDVVAVVETQKGAIEIECFEDGVVDELRAEVGAEVPVGAPLALILAPGEDRPAERGPEPQHPKPPTAQPVSPLPPETPHGPAASPAARMRARDLGVDLAGLTGSGPGGAILLADVVPPAEVMPQPVPRADAQTEMRRAIAAAMTRAKREIPHFYLSATMDVQPARDWLSARNADRPPDERLLLGALFVRAVVLAARAVPVMNGHYRDEAFHPAPGVNVGVAVALRGGGLVAPALIGAERLDLPATMAGMRDLVMRARAGRLRGSEMSEGTITVSSLGETGAEAMAGVIFPPQVALVGIGAPQLRPWVVAGAIVPRHVVTVTVSADHRVSDGRQAARFLAAFEKQIATPEGL
ncbi:dihydrolipoamide acetyltransferase family protein [Alloyangia pacifica]|uniref:dihydrolipoamide acetyltransferase family protein n=1 Tax=Alloyangia pacifica TaxID=311180 RepID=UPI001CFE2197|nr:dihydrolipoamide acetyltransferase family protein [Alloyangia pacifica]